MQSNRSILSILLLIGVLFSITDGSLVEDHTVFLNGESYINGQGYHLKLVVSGEIGGLDDRQHHDKNLAIKIHCDLPKEVYIDRYEIAEANRLGFFPSFYLSDLSIDLEKPSDSPSSLPFYIEVFLPLSSSQTAFQAEIPFHLRYQPTLSLNEEAESVSYGNYRIINLPNPRISLVELTTNQNNEHKVFLETTAKARVSTSLSSTATWAQIASGLTVGTPVGAESHRAWVTYLTLVVTAVGATFLISSIIMGHSFKQAPKTEESRK